MPLENSVTKVKNPLTMVSVFATISEIAMAYVITTLPDKLQEIFIWFVMGFPTVLVFIFFFILYRKPAVFFSPGDYRREELYVSSIGLGGFNDSTRIKKLEDSVAILDVFLEKTKPGVAEQVEYTKIRKTIQKQQDLQTNPLYAFITRDLGVAHDVAQRWIATANDVWELPKFLEADLDDQRRTVRLTDLLQSFPSAEMDFQKLKPFVQFIGETN
ncbi:hypothetical protein [Castellaniella sp.]|uniref:hypothetical protein n=1 Tax=Castellaniella sp. TaxID=1955812 RepID=UPI003C78C5FC